MKRLILIFILLPLLGIGQTVPRLQKASHTFILSGDSLTIFQEAEFSSQAKWYADSIYISRVAKTIKLDIYYQPEITTVSFTSPFLSFTNDTIGFDKLSPGRHRLIVNSYGLSDSLDRYYIAHVFPKLRDSDTSYFSILPKPLSIYPNPAKDNLTIEGLEPEYGPITVSISELKGKLVLETTASHSQPEIDVSSLPQGSYILTTPITSPQLFLIQ